MPETIAVAATGLQTIDGILSGTKWASPALTFSLPSSGLFYEYDGERNSGFQALSSAQSAAVRKGLLHISSVANVTFAEVEETATNHADVRFAATAMTSTAWAYQPSSSAAAGDVWISATSPWFKAPVVGSYGYLVTLHETAHALGLKHGQDTGRFGALPADHNSMEFSIMTYASYIGANTSYGYRNAPGSYAQSLMMDDIAALQQLYGANFASNGGATVFKWDPLTGQQFINGIGQGLPAGNKVFLTIWDGGGTDTYDFSNYTTNLKVDLRPGAWSTISATQLADLGSDAVHLARGNIANAMLYQDDTRSLIENARGGSGHDTITGNTADNALSGGAGNDVLSGLGGDDWLTGGAGADKLLGGDGFDTISYAASLAVRVDLLSSGTAGEALGDTFSSIESIVGSSYADWIAASNDANRVSGGAGNDTLYGRGGDDTLVGGAGSDILSGGAGIDVFAYYSRLEGFDTISDFQHGVDKIGVNAAAFGLTHGETEVSSAMLQYGKVATVNHAVFVYDATLKTLWFDADGTGAAAANAVAKFSIAVALSASDFIVL